MTWTLRRKRTDPVLDALLFIKDRGTQLIKRRLAAKSQIEMRPHNIAFDSHLQSNSKNRHGRTKATVALSYGIQDVAHKAWRPTLLKAKAYVDHLHGENPTRLHVIVRTGYRHSHGLTIRGLLRAKIVWIKVLES